MKIIFGTLYILFLERTPVCCGRLMYLYRASIIPDSFSERLECRSRRSGVLFLTTHLYDLPKTAWQYRRGNQHIFPNTTDLSKGKNTQ